MGDRETKISMVKANLRSVTQSCKGGVPMERLEGDYRDLLGTSIPYRDLGFSSLETMIRNMPDAVKLVRNEMGRFNVVGVADRSTAHIASLVARQKPSKTKKIGIGKSRFRTSYSRGGGSSRPFSNYPRNRFQSNWRQTTAPSKPKPFEQIENSRSTSSSSQRSDSRSEKWSSPSPPNSKKGTLPNKPINNAYVPPHNRASQVRSTKEIPPRFLKQLQQQITVTIPNPESSIEVSESIPRSIASPVPSSMSQFSPAYDLGIPPPKDLKSNSTFNPSPKPKPKERKRNLLQTPPLPSQSPPMEFIAEYARANNVEYKFTTSKIGQRTKKFISVLMLGDRKFQTFPEERNTPQEAEELAASLAVDYIQKEEEENKFEKITLETFEDIQTFIQRVEKIVIEKPNGIWSMGIPSEYQTKYAQSLPPNWLQVLKSNTSPNIDIEMPERMHIARDACILRYINSGTTTPTSTSSKASNHLSDDLGNNATNINSDLYLDLPETNEWPVLVTYVSNTQNIAVRLIDQEDEFRVIDEEMQNFYKEHLRIIQRTHINKLYAAQQIVNNENRFYRIRLDDVNTNLKQATCYFVDIGDTNVLNLSELQELDSQFESLPFQAIPMSLDGLEDYSDLIKAEVLVDKLLDKPLIADIKKRIDNQISAVLFDTSGPSDINLNAALKELALNESLGYPALPEPGCTTMAYLGHATANGEIFLRFENPSQGLLDIEMEKLSAKFEEAPAVPLNAMTFDNVYVARYTDGLYYRTQMVDSSEPTEKEIEMFYIDYGNVSPVTISEIKDLSAISKFLASWPPQAIPCTLNDVPPPNFSWNDNVLAKLFELVPDTQELIVKVDKSANETSPAEVTLFMRNETNAIISINQTLSFSNLFSPLKSNGAVNAVKPSSLPLYGATSAEDENLPPLPDINSKINYMTSPSALWTPTPDGGIDPTLSETIPPPAEIPDVGAYFDVYVTFVASPSNFMVQPLKSALQLDSLLKDMNSFYQAEENQCEMHQVLLKLHNYYAALYDETWYRAKIEAIEDEGEPVMVTVYFIDFGDFAKVSLTNLQPLYQRFRSLPCQAIKASLHGISPLYSDWLPENCVETKELLTEKQFVSCVKNIRKTRDNNSNVDVLELALVDTTSPTRDVFIHDILIQKKVACRSS